MASVSKEFVKKGEGMYGFCVGDYTCMIQALYMLIQNANFCWFVKDLKSTACRLFSNALLCSQTYSIVMENKSSLSITTRTEECDFPN